MNCSSVHCRATLRNTRYTHAHAHTNPNSYSLCNAAVLCAAEQSSCFTFWCEAGICWTQKKRKSDSALMASLSSLQQSLYGWDKDIITDLHELRFQAVISPSRRVLMQELWFIWKGFGSFPSKRAGPLTVHVFSAALRSTFFLLVSRSVTRRLPFASAVIGFVHKMSLIRTLGN